MNTGNMKMRKSIMGWMILAGEIVMAGYIILICRELYSHSPTASFNGYVFLVGKIKNTVPFWYAVVGLSVLGSVLELRKKTDNSVFFLYRPSTKAASLLSFGFSLWVIDYAIFRHPTGPSLETVAAAILVLNCGIFLSYLMAASSLHNLAG